MQTLSFDALDRPLRVQYPSGEVISNTYDREGPNTLLAGTDDLVTDITFNLMGQIEIDGPVVLDRRYHPTTVRVFERPGAGDPGPVRPDNHLILLRPGKGMLVDDSLPREQVHEAIARVVLGIVLRRLNSGPGSELGEGAGHADIENAVANGLHMLVNMAGKHRPEPVTGR